MWHIFWWKIVRNWVLITILQNWNSLFQSKVIPFFRFSSNHTIQAYVKEDFVIWWNQYFFFEMPRNRSISFLVTFSFLKTIVTCFSSKCPSFNGSKSSKWPILPFRKSDWRMGQSKVSKRRKVEHFAGKPRGLIENV